MTQPMVSLDDPSYDAAVMRITSAVVDAGFFGEDPQPAFRATVFVLSMLLDADKGMVTPKAIRQRGAEVGKVVAEQVRWMREQRETTGEPMLHSVMRDFANLAARPGPSGAH